MPLSLLAAALLAAAPPSLDAAAKVTAVTVFNDRARVVRTGKVQLDGAALVSVALLPGSVSADSVRLEAHGAEVRRVELAKVDELDFPTGQAQQLLDKLEAKDDQLTAVLREQEKQLAVIEGLKPEVQPDLPSRPAPRLNTAGWAQALAFYEAQLDKVQAHLRALEQRRLQLQRERDDLAAEARRVGAGRRRAGLQVNALLSGHGEAKLTLVYLVGGARWTPAWELTYLPAQEKVQVALSGLVTQATGEEWEEAELTLSTAVPGVSSQLPKLLTWKIGQKERFEPQSHAVTPPAPPQPAPYAPELEPPVEPGPKAEADSLRSKLLDRAERVAALEPELEGDEPQAQARAAQLTAPREASEAKPQPAKKQEGSNLALAAPKPAPPPAPGSAAPSSASSSEGARLAKEQMKLVPRSGSTRSFESVVTSVPGAKSEVYGVELNGAGSPEMAYVIDGIQVNEPTGGSDRRARTVPSEAVAFAPPPSYRPPQFGPDAPATLAGGYDLSFTSPRPATVPNGSYQRRVPLFAETWSASAERVLYPGIAKEAWLMATLKNPSQRALPGGPADLFVGDDPSGTANLEVLAPGAPLELPLGLDRALKPVRNVQQVQGEKGLFSKDEVTRYTVTIELGNPYKQALPVRIIDQLPLAADQNTEVKLLAASPEAAPGGDDGKLEWRLQLPASGKAQVSFTYELKRPKGALLHQ
jgi:hypothetical protein